MAELCRVQVDLDLPQDALKACGYATEFGSTNPLIPHLSAAALIELKQYDEAIAIYDQQITAI